MKNIRVLIVDDSVVVRKVLAEIIENEPFFEVAGIALNGKEALEVLPSLLPDIVILDVEMPEMNGLETLAAIRKKDTQLPIIMFSTLTVQGGKATLEALSSGANDYITKPSNTGSLRQSIAKVRRELLPKIRGLCLTYDTIHNKVKETNKEDFVPDAAPPRKSIVAEKRKPYRPPAPPTHKGAFDVLAIGASTGGPNALASIIGALPADFPIPIVIVQHMPPVFTKLLAERIDGKSPLEVKEAVDGEPIYAGGVWVAPGDYHLEIVQSGRHLLTRLHQNGVKFKRIPSVDVLFSSLARINNKRILSLVLTGMGNDGMEGCKLLQERNTYIVAQDEYTSTIWGMPKAVVDARLAHEVLPLDKIATRLVELANRSKDA